MGYTKIIATMKWWDPHTKKIKYFIYAKFDEHNNKFGKVWSPGSELMTVTTKIFPSNTKTLFLRPPPHK